MAFLGRGVSHADKPALHFCVVVPGPNGISVATKARLLRAFTAYHSSYPTHIINSMNNPQNGPNAGESRFLCWPWMKNRPYRTGAAHNANGKCRQAYISNPALTGIVPPPQVQNAAFMAAAGAQAHAHPDGHRCNCASHLFSREYGRFHRPTSC